MVNELAREASFPAPEFERERRQKLEEVKLERTSPGFLASERLRKVLFGAHPYGQVSASEAQVAAYTREDLLAVYRDFYTPENALLLMVGDFDSQAMVKTAEKVFGAWTGKKPQTKPAAAPPHPHGRRVYLVHVPGAVQTQILAGCAAITRTHPDWIKLGPDQQPLRRRIQFAPGHEYPRRQGLHLQPSQRRPPAARARLLFRFRRCPQRRRRRLAHRNFL